MGLLEGLAGGMKGYADAFSEQVKQEAITAREMNMLRIGNIFAKEGRQETIAAAASEGRLNRGSTEKVAELRETGENIRLGTTTKAAEDRATAHESFQVALQKEGNNLAVALEATKDSNERQRLTIQYKNHQKLQELANLAPGPTAKIAQDLEKMGVPKAEIPGYILPGLSGEKQDKVAYVTMYSSLLRMKTEGAKAEGRSVTPAEVAEIQQEASLASGHIQKGAAAAKSAASPRARAKAEQAAKTNPAAVGSSTAPLLPAASNEVGATSPGLIKSVMGRSAMGIDTKAILGPTGQNRIDQLNRELKAGTISREAYNKAISEANEEIKAGLGG